MMLQRNLIYRCFPIYNIFSSPVPNQKRLVIKLRRAWELQLITQLRLWKLPVPNNKQSKPTPKRYDKPIRV